MADEKILDLPEDIDEQIVDFVRENPALTVDSVVRDIARLHCIVHLINEKILGEHAVLTGGMAMRCLSSPRFSVYDTDTSSIPEITHVQLLDALNYGDDDLAVSIAKIAPDGYGKDLISAHPIEFDPRFTRLQVSDTTFKLTVSHRGVECSAQWLPLATGYPFPLWPQDAYRVPVMATTELLAEKLAAWWIFAPAKHYADIAFLGAYLFKQRLVAEVGTKAEVRKLVDMKLERNKDVSRNHRERVERLTEEERRERLLNPAEYVDPEHPFNRLSFFGSSPQNAESMKAAVTRWIVPLLFD